MSIVKYAVVFAGASVAGVALYQMAKSNNQQQINAAQAQSDRFQNNTNILKSNFDNKFWPLLEKTELRGKTVENQYRHQMKKQARGSGGLFGAIGSIAAPVLGVALAPFTGGASLAIGSAAGGIFGSLPFDRQKPQNYVYVVPVQASVSGQPKCGEIVMDRQCPCSKEGKCPCR